MISALVCLKQKGLIYTPQDTELSLLVSCNISILGKKKCNFGVIKSQILPDIPSTKLLIKRLSLSTFSFVKQVNSMTLPIKLSITTVGAAAILSLLSVPVSAFTIKQPTGAAYDLSDPLGDIPIGAIGTVTLNPSVLGYLAPAAAGANLFTRFKAEAATQFPNWTAVSGAALGGILIINEYPARDYVDEPKLNPKRSTPRGGADMVATYARASTDPAITNLRFIQLFTKNTGPNGAVVSHIDPFPNDDLSGNKLPWYWTEAEHTENSTATTMTFADSASDPVTIPFNRTVRFETYLATFNNKTKVATIRDGWSGGYDVHAVNKAVNKTAVGDGWSGGDDVQAVNKATISDGWSGGDDVQAVPEPATIFGSAIALGCGAFFKRKVLRKCKKS